MFLPCEKLFPVKFMLDVPYVSSREKLSPVKFMLGVQYLREAREVQHLITDQ